MTNIIPLLQDGYKKYLSEDFKRLNIQDSLAQSRLEYNNLVKSLETSKEYIAMKMLEKELEELNKNLTNAQELIKEMMISNELKSISIGDKELVLIKSPGALQVKDESLVPNQYFKEKITKSLDKILIKKELDNGVILPGCTIEHSYRLEFKNNSLKNEMVE